jgi:hypothetical protein
MGIFKRKRPEPPTSQDLDEQTLAKLQEVGADSDTPRLWEHFIYCDDESGAAILEGRASEAGWDVEQFDAKPHGIVASRRDRPVNPQTVAEARTFFEELAASVPGGDYDGWGAEG